LCASAAPAKDHVRGCGQIPPRISEAYAVSIDEADTQRGLMLNYDSGCGEVPVIQCSSVQRSSASRAATRSSHEDV